MRLIRPIRVTLWALLLVTGGALASDALGGPAPPVHIDVSARPQRSINAYNLFRNVAQQIPNEGLVPYAINAPLFADYAAKHRFLYLPPGAKVTYRPEGPFDFPVGTVLVKTFTLPQDRRAPESGERILETRLLMHRKNGWVGYPYVWNEDLSDARLAVAGARIPVSWIHDDGSPRQTVYGVPNMNECKFCHVKNDRMAPIGPKARQLNRKLTYGGGEEDQLAHWIRVGILEELPEQSDLIPSMASWEDSEAPLNARARAYLDGNCAHCHSPGGDAGPTGLDFSWSQHDPQSYGVFRKPTAAGPASKGFLYAIRPGQPEESLVPSRMRATEPGLLMPRTGRSIPHEEGIELIESWIAAMDPGLDSPTYFEDGLHPEAMPDGPPNHLSDEAP